MVAGPNEPDFGGHIGRTYSESTPWWPEPPAGLGGPNVVMIKEGLEGGHTKPAWWMRIFPFLRWRFEWDRDHWHGQLEENQHTVLHRTITDLCIVVFALLAYQGWYILTYLKPPWR